MPDELRIDERPKLRHPVLVTAFRGWNDGGQGATLAAGFLAKAWQAARFAEIDPEEFYDFQVSRPQVSLVDGVTRKLEWPDNAFYHAAIPGLERDAVLLLGIEPNTRWRRFTELIVGLSEDLGVELVVSLGSLLADGIGDTLRVSLTADPVKEVEVAWEILKALGLRERGPVMIACPSCGRDNVGVEKLARVVEERLDHLDTEEAEGSSGPRDRKHTNTKEKRITQRRLRTRRFPEESLKDLMEREQSRADALRLPPPQPSDANPVKLRRFRPRLNDLAHRGPSHEGTRTSDPRLGGC